MVRRKDWCGCSEGRARGIGERQLRCHSVAVRTSSPRFDNSARLDSTFRLSDRPAVPEWKSLPTASGQLCPRCCWAGPDEDGSGTKEAPDFVKSGASFVVASEGFEPSKLSRRIYSPLPLAARATRQFRREAGARIQTPASTCTPCVVGYAHNALIAHGRALLWQTVVLTS